MELSGSHNRDGCLRDREFARVVFPSWTGPEGPAARGERMMWLDAPGVLEHIGDDMHNWRFAGYADRVEVMGLCIPGLLSFEALGEDLFGAQQLLAWEGLAESLHVLPYPAGLLGQPHCVVQGFAAIREAKTAHQLREIRQQKEDAAKRRTG